VGDRVIANQLLEMEQHRVGFAFWTWKENGSGNWSLFEGANPSLAPMPANGCLKPDLERLVVRVYPLASADPRLAYHYDPSTGAFNLQARGRSGDAPTVVYVPSEVTGQIEVTGSLAGQEVAVNADGSRTVTATPSGGPFSIAVSSGAFVAAGCA
jgi:hypothetical protein